MEDYWPLGALIIRYICGGSRPILRKKAQVGKCICPQVDPSNVSRETIWEAARLVIGGAGRKRDRGGVRTVGRIAGSQESGEPGHVPRLVLCQMQRMESGLKGQFPLDPGTCFTILCPEKTNLQYRYHCTVDRPVGDRLR